MMRLLCRRFSSKIIYGRSSNLMGSNKHELLKINKEKRAQMLSKLAEYPPGELLENYKKVLRAVLNSQIDRLPLDEKSKSKQELALVFDKVVQALKPGSSEIEILREFLVYPYPEWFTLECSSTLFDIYEILINRLFEADLKSEEKGAKKSGYDRELLVKILPNLITMFVYSRLVTFEVGQARLESLTEEASDEMIEVLELRYQMEAIERIVGEKVSTAEVVQVRSKIRYTEGEFLASTEKDFLYKPKPADKPSEPDRESAEARKSLAALGVIDSSRSRAMLDKLYHCLCFRFRYSSIVDLELMLKTMTSSKHFHAGLLDLLNLDLDQRFDKVSLDYFLLFMETFYKAGMYFPHYHLYRFREKYLARISSMLPAQLFKTLRMLTRAQPPHFSLFNKKLLKKSLSRKVVETLPLSQQCGLVFQAAKNPHTPSSRLKELLQMIDLEGRSGDLTIFDIKLLLMSSQYSPLVYTINFKSFVPQLGKFGREGAHVQALIEEFVQKQPFELKKLELEQNLRQAKESDGSSSSSSESSSESSSSESSEEAEASDPQDTPQPDQTPKRKPRTASKPPSNSVTAKTAEEGQQGLEGKVEDPAAKPKSKRTRKPKAESQPPKKEQPLLDEIVVEAPQVERAQPTKPAPKKRPQKPQSKPASGAQTAN